MARRNWLPRSGLQCFDGQIKGKQAKVMTVKPQVNMLGPLHATNEKASTCQSDNR